MEKKLGVSFCWQFKWNARLYSLWKCSEIVSMKYQALFAEEFDDAAIKEE